MRHLGWVLIFGLMGAIGCSRSASVPNEDIAALPDTGLPLGDPQFFQRYSKLKLRCGSESCSASGGLLLVQGPDGKPLTCTAIALEGDRILTSEACLPAELRRPRVSCASHIRFYPGLESGESWVEGLACDRVDEIGPKGTDDAAPTYAILRVLGSPGEPVRFSNGELADRKRVRVATISNFGIGSLSATLKWIPCEILQRSLVQPRFLSPTSAVGVLGGCSLGSFSPGAGVYDESGQWIGLVASPVMLSEPSLGELARLLGRSVGRMSYVINAYCLAENRLTSKQAECFERPSRVDVENSVRKRELREIDQEALQGMIRARLKEWVDRTDSGKQLRWRLIWYRGQTEDEAFVVAVPDCFLSPAAWLGRYKKGFLFKKNDYRGHATLERHVPLWRYRMRLSAELVWQPEITGSEERVSVFEFSPNQLVTKGHSEFTFGVDYTTGFYLRLLHGQMEACVN